LSRTEIAIYKKYPNEKIWRNSYVERAQKDQSMSFKLHIVQDIERGQLTDAEATKMGGTQNRSTFFL
jgi:predicted RNA-binding protein with EMAP domain